MNKTENSIIVKNYFGCFVLLLILLYYIEINLNDKLNNDTTLYRFKKIQRFKKVILNEFKDFLNKYFWDMTKK